MTDSFPKTAPVFSIGCSVCPEGSSSVGEFYPVLIFSNFARVQFQEAVCGKCRKSLKVDDYLTSALWSSIVAAETDNGTTSPRRDQTRLEFVAVTDSQADAATLAAIQEDERASKERVGRVVGGRFSRAGSFTQ